MPIVAVNELYRTNEIIDGPEFTVVRKFIVDTTPDYALDPNFVGGGVVAGSGESTIALPPKGEQHQQYPDLFVDNRVVAGRATTERTFVNVIYKRNTFGDTNPYRDDTDPLGAIQYNEPISQIQSLTVPRILKRDLGTTNLYTTYASQIDIPVSIMRVTTYIKSYSPIVASVIRAYNGIIDTHWNDTGKILSSERAMFVGGNVRFLGNKYQIVYTWRVKREFEPLPTFTINESNNTLVQTGGGGVVESVHNYDSSSAAGEFYPFSQISIMRQGIAEVQQSPAEREPVYFENPHRSHFTETEVFENLPGLIPPGV